MQSEAESNRMRNRGLLTKRDRKALRGERDVSSEQLQDIRWNVKKRIERIQTDLEILEDADEGDLIDEFWNNFDRQQQLEERVAELESEVKNDE